MPPSGKRILIVGGRGFVGGHLAVALAAAGHDVTAAGHDGVDLARHDGARLGRALAGFQVVINCAGLIRDRRDAPMTAVHGEGVVRLIESCRMAGVGRLIHLSALGASVAGRTAFQRTKGAAEAALQALDPDGAVPDWCVLRPSLVIGRGGASTTLFAALAALPRPVRLARGDWQVQPVHVDDLAGLVVVLVGRSGPLPRVVDVVGPVPLTTDDLTLILRHWLGLTPVRPLPVPEPLLRLAAAAGGWIGRGALTPETLAMLAAGNTGDPGPLAAWLGRSPHPLAEALAHHPATQADRWHARLMPVRPLLRGSIGLLWLATGLVSFGLYPIESSHALLAQVGLDGIPADVALYGAAALDTLLGVLLLAGIRPVAVGAAQLVAMAAFTVIAVALPAEMWLHPFAPLLKNLPLAAATLAMMALEA